MMQDEMTGLYCDGTEKTRSLRPSCKIKICGLSRPEDIRAANRILPDYIGFVFAESSRRITVSQAVRLKAALDPRIRAVGGFCKCTHKSDFVPGGGGTWRFCRAGD